MADGKSPQVITEAIINCNLYGGMNYLTSNLTYSRLPICISNSTHIAERTSNTNAFQSF